MVLLSIAQFNYSSDDKIIENNQVLEETTETIYTLPVVIHIIHSGELVGVIFRN